MTEIMNNIGLIAATFIAGYMFSMGIYAGWRTGAILFGPMQTRSTTDVNLPPIPPIVIRHE